MNTQIDQMPEFWCVTSICSPNKSLSSGLIHQNSISLLFVSDSFFKCLVMIWQKMPQHLGGSRPVFNKSVTIQKVSEDTLVRLLNYEAERSASNYDDDYSNSFRELFAGSLVAIWITMLMSKKDLDFRKPDCGVKSSEVRKCLR